MQQSPKAPEPSMEDILASIRKIIAEDPAAAPAVPQTASPAPTSPALSAAPVAGRRPLAELDRELADLLEEPAGGKQEPQLGPPGSEAASSKPNSEAALAPSASAEAAPSRFGWIRGRTGSPATNGASGVQPSLPPLTAEPDTRRPASLGDTTSVLTATPEISTPPKAAAPAPAQAAIVRPMPEAAPPKAPAAAAKPEPATASSPSFPTEWRPSRQGSNGATPPKDSPAAPQPSIAAAGSAAPVATTPAPAPEAKSAPQPSTMPAPVTAQPEPVAAFTVAPANPVSIPGPVAEAPAAVAQRTVEDTLAELLRPMVRQWLEENMSRAIEKAIRVEIASSVRTSVGKPGGSDKS